MPVSGDYARRRAALVEAVLNIVAHRGLDEVSVREVAAEAGVSPAKVQYYFRTKDEMLIAVFRQVEELLRARARTVPRDTGTVACLRAQALTWLPRSPSGRTLARAWVAFTARALVTAELAEIEARFQERMHADMQKIIRRGVAAGEFTADADLEATLFLSLLDGLVIRLLCDPCGFSYEQAVAALDAHLTGRFRPC